MFGFDMTRNGQRTAFTGLERSLSAPGKGRLIDEEFERPDDA